MDPSKPNEPSIDQGRSIPRSRPADDEVLEGEIIGKDEPLRRPGPVPPSPPKPPKRGLGVRKTLLIVVAVVALGLCLGGSITAYVLYDKATRPDRSSPTVTLQQYLNARINAHDDAKASVFVCGSPELNVIDSEIDRIRDLEAKFDIAVTASFSDMALASAGEVSELRLKINFVIPEEDERKSVLVQDWKFEMVYANGWRVCGAEKTY
ncbi:hypothetical protein ACFO1B_19965 [Dactylosporangium siamense]|uniref:Uncharacterized protein n=1 Tax=Dactylosporangium siamense TaxID=685454 RepID=A0A919PLR6_9ACTN|nr:hypothetical protein [Dactylosporangium siamense]GIG46996.1 hypothetical protein Dsi01nite_050370 [Dactylosporangium siamense]